VLQRKNIDANCFMFQRGGVDVEEFFCEREDLGGGKRGHWLLMRRTIAGLFEADRDQYSNDIIERLDNYLNDPNRQGARSYGIRFKRKCTKAEFLMSWPDWKADLEFQFDGEWTAEYYDWEGKAVLTKVMQ